MFDSVRNRFKQGSEGGTQAVWPPLAEMGCPFPWVFLNFPVFQHFWPFGGLLEGFWPGFSVHSGRIPMNALSSRMGSVEFLVFGRILGYFGRKWPFLVAESSEFARIAFWAPRIYVFWCPAWPLFAA